MEKLVLCKNCKHFETNSWDLNGERKALHRCMKRIPIESKELSKIVGKDVGEERSLLYYELNYLNKCEHFGKRNA